MDTAEALKKAMQAIKDAGIPESMWETALPLALADVRGAVVAVAPATPPPDVVTAASAKGTSQSPKKKRAPKKPSSSSNGDSATMLSVLSGLPEQDELFKKIANETDVKVQDLGDVFYVEDGQLHLKVASKKLGDSTSGSVKTIAALLSGVVLAGTSNTKVPFKDISAVCKEKNCHDPNNGASYIKATPGFAGVGSGASQALTARSGWQDEFANAVNRVLGKGDTGS
jgi:hypothetical protein